MKNDDRQLGKPFGEYTATKAQIEAISGLVGGETAYAEDTEQMGYYNGSSWQWINPTGTTGGGHIIQDDGVDITERIRLNFVGNAFKIYDGGTSTIVSGTTFDGLTFHVSSGGNDSNSGLTSGTAVATVSEVLRRLRGHVVHNCGIKIYPGTYVETLDFTGILCSSPDDLVITGDVAHSFVANSYVHRAGHVLFADQGTGGRIRFIISGSNSNLSGNGISTSNKIIFYNGVPTVYSIYSISNNAITTTVSGSAPSIYSGTCVTILPEVIFERTGVDYLDSFIADGSKLTIKGAYFHNNTAKTYLAKVHNQSSMVLDQVVLYAYQSPAGLDVRNVSSVVSNGDPVTIFGDTWISAGSSVVVPSSTFQEVTVERGSFMDISNGKIVGGTAGLTSRMGGYIYASNVSNMGDLGFSPATSNTFGTTMGAITF